MACDINTGRLRACKQNLGGLGELYLFNFVQDPFTVVNGVATAINPSLTVVYKFEIEGDGNNIAESLVPDRNTGTSVNTQTTTIVLKKNRCCDFFTIKPFSLWFSYGGCKR